jgi:hypothetical protein
LDEVTGLTTFFNRLSDINKTVMPLTLSKAPLHTVLDNPYRTKDHIGIKELHFEKNKREQLNLHINRPFLLFLFFFL